MTFSIVARSADGESWGVAVASKFLAVGSAVPAAVAGVGAIATQAGPTSPTRGWRSPSSTRARPPPVALQRLLEEDDGRDHRQVGIVDAEGGAATPHRRRLPRLGRRAHRRRRTRSRATSSPARRWSTRWRRPGTTSATPASPWPAGCSPRCAAGDDAGGDSRGRQSAALLVVARRRRLRRPRRRRGRPAGRRPRRPVRRAGPAARPQRALPHRLDRGREGAADAPSCAPSSRRSPRRAGPRDLRRLGRHRELRDARRPGRHWIDQQVLEIVRAATRDGAPAVSVLAIDAGTTGVTAVVVSTGRTIAAKGYQEFAPALPPAGLGRARAGGDLAGHARGHPRRC